MPTGPSYRIAMGPDFVKDQRRFSEQPAVLADLLETVTELASQPFHNPRLQTHKVRGAQSGVMTSYVGSHPHRVIWFHAKQTIMLLLFDRHDEAYRRAERVKVSLDSGENVTIEITEQASVSKDAVRTPAPIGATGPAPFDPWDDTLLGEAGFASHEINILRDVRDEDGLSEAQRFLSPESFDLALSVLLARSDHDVRSLGAALVDDGADPHVVEAVERSVDADESSTIVSVPPSDLQAVLVRPIEDWMVFLHPDQRELVAKTFAGPARVSGGAGTGKTVVGIHRAARLAGEGRRVLFTTYINTLPSVLKHLHGRLEPGRV